MESPVPLLLRLRNLLPLAFKRLPRLDTSLEIVRWKRNKIKWFHRLDPSVILLLFEFRPSHKLFFHHFETPSKSTIESLTNTNGKTAVESPAVKAFDTYTNTVVYKCADTCDDLEMGEMGKLFVKFFEGMRYVIVLASLSKQPADMSELVAHFKPITEPMGEIKKLRLKRDFDSHQKAICEMMACCSWVTCRPPAQLPAPFVTECIGSSDFWSNRIRKEFKGKDDDKAKLQLKFCDSLKATIVELSNYIKAHHTTGLTFNPKGVSLAESAVRMTDNPIQDAAIEANRKKDQQAGKKSKDIGKTVKGGNMLGLVSELANRRSGDGSSAATGLRKVRYKSSLVV